MKAQSHRGVGGLISLIALVIVFGVIALVMIDLNLTHAVFFQEQNKVSGKLHDRNLEDLNFIAEHCILDDDSTTHFKSLNLTITNNSPQISSIDSVFLLNDTEVTKIASSFYVFDNKTSEDLFLFNNDTGRVNFKSPSIKAVDSSEFKIDNVTEFATPDNQKATKIMLVTKLGNKIMNTFDFVNNCVT